MHEYSSAFPVVLEYALASLIERRTEEEHKRLKAAGSRGLTYAGPALACAHKRRPQLLEMIDDPVDLAWLCEQWNGRHLFHDLLGHMLSSKEVDELSIAARHAKLIRWILTPGMQADRRQWFQRILEHSEH